MSQLTSRIEFTRDRQESGSLARQEGADRTYGWRHKDKGDPVLSIVEEER